MKSLFSQIAENLTKTQGRGQGAALLHDVIQHHAPGQGQAAESQQAYDDYASGSNSQPGTSGRGAAMGGEFDVNRSTKIDDEAPF